MSEAHNAKSATNLGSSPTTGPKSSVAEPLLVPPTGSVAPGTSPDQTATLQAGRIVDLTITLRRNQRGVDWETARTVERDGWNARTLHLYSHAGTHVDAPVHFAVSPQSIDQLPLERFMGPALVARLPNLAPGALIEISQLGSVAELLQPGDILLLHTGWSTYLDRPKIYRDGLPRVSEALARWCVEHRVKLLGVEPPSVADVNNLPELTLIHHILLGGGVSIVEGLTNLDQVSGPKTFFAALPLKIEGADGCPCRAFAVEGWHGISPAGDDARTDDHGAQGGRPSHNSRPDVDAGSGSHHANE